jgi:hypothetical protein
VFKRAFKEVITECDVIKKVIVTEGVSRSATRRSWCGMYNAKETDNDTLGSAQAAARGAGDAILRGSVQWWSVG